MAMKDLFRELQPLPLYAMLALTLLFFTVELVVSHLTHALTLLVDSYHTLVNLIALVGCLITVKYGRSSMRAHSPRESCTGDEELDSGKDHAHSGCAPGCHGRDKNQGSSPERRLRNTFGWARIEVLVMLIGTVFLAALCFSLVVEAVQTLFHIGHQDEMHHPIPVMLVGATGLVLNGLCYLLIGGYTFHQGSFLHVTASGDVVLDRALSHEAMRQGGRRLSTRRQAAATAPPVTAAAAAASPADAVQQLECATGNVSASPPVHLHAQVMRQGPREMLRDVIGCVFVIVCSIIVYFTEQGVAKFVDPILSIVSALLLLLLSIPYMKESGRILLQTIPDYIDIESLKSELILAFPSLVNVHEVHIWCLTPTRVFATAHLVLRTHQDYVQIKEALIDFFHEHGITQATIQPEFFKASDKAGEVEPECFLQCRGEGCLQRHCCRGSSTSSSQEDLHTVSCLEAAATKAEHGHSHGGHAHAGNHGHAHAHGGSHGHAHDGGHTHTKALRRQTEARSDALCGLAELQQQQQQQADERQQKEESSKAVAPVPQEVGTRREQHQSESEDPHEGHLHLQQQQSAASDSATCLEKLDYGITRVSQHSVSGEDLHQIVRDVVRHTK